MNFDSDREPQPRLIRRCAAALLSHAARVLPPARAAWAAAMRSELDHIEGDTEALRWAAGCVIAGYVERSHVPALLDTWPARILLALLIGTQVLSFLFATALTLAWRMHALGVAAFLGSFTPGDDYHRFLPLLTAPNWWQHALWVTASALFFASGWQLLRRNRAAFPLFAAGWILGTIGNLMAQASPVYRQVFSFPQPMFTRDYLIPVASALLPVLLTACLWIEREVDGRIAAGSPLP